MTLTEAQEKLYRLNRKSSLSPEEEFELTEILKYLIENTGDYGYAQWLGGIYYEKRIFDQALKYYEMAEMMGSPWAPIGLGYIWYYGRTGEVNYEKAFNYFKKACEYEGDDLDDRDRTDAIFKLADMYKNGYHVEKDPDRYRQMIEDLHEDIMAKRKHDPSYRLAEVAVRLGLIRAKEGRNEEALKLYYEARRELIDRVRYNRFFGDLNRIKWLEDDIYALLEFDPTEFDLFDLYYLLKEEHLVSFRYKGKRYQVEAIKEEGQLAIRFEDSWYRNIDDFFLKAELAGRSIENAYYDLEDWRIER